MSLLVKQNDFVVIKRCSKKHSVNVQNTGERKGL